MAVYLDYNATTPLAPEVVASISHSLKVDWANPSSDSALGKEARKAITLAREQVAAMINATPQDILFTSGGTESNNIAILSAVEWGRQFFSTPHIILSNVEHVATSAPVKHLASEGNIDYTKVAVNKNGCLEVEDVLSAVRPETVLVTVMMANNETGVIFPVQEIGRELKALNHKRKNRVWFHVDAAQAIGKIPVDVTELDIDYLTIVGHKFYGPRIGALYVRKVLAERVVSPVVRGGGQERGWRPGTENTPMIVGLGSAAVLVLKHLDMYSNHMREIRDYLLHQLKKRTGCVVNCEQSPRLPNTLSVSWPGCQLRGHELLDKCQHVVASTTAACHDQDQLSEVLLLSGVPEGLAQTTVRLSVGRSTTKEDINTVVADMEQALGQSAVSITSS